MPLLPRPPWARPRERCPNCLAKTPDARALVCDRCGYQLRLPRLTVAGIALIVFALGNFFMSVFGGFLFPWPALPFGWRLPFLASPTPADLSRLALWIGGIAFLAGTAVAFAGAYRVRRAGDRVRAQRAVP